MKYLADSWKRWMVWLLLAGLFATACGFLSEWQFHRRQEKVAYFAIMERNYEAPVSQLEKLVPEVSEFDAQREWSRVEVQGRYLSAKALLVRNRPYEGAPGFLQLIPFQLQTGRVIFIERGWLPTGSAQDSPDSVPIPDDTERTVVVRLRAPEASSGRDAPAGQVAELYLPAAAKAANIPAGDIYRAVYGRLVSEQPPSASYPQAIPRPEVNEGNHLSYAFQWIVFGVLGFVTLWYAVRQEIHFKRLATDASYVPKRKRVTRADLDAAAEDGSER